jgi:hypothetical protein
VRLHRRKYQPLIDALYSDKKQQFIETVVKLKTAAGSVSATGHQRLNEPRSRGRSMTKKSATSSSTSKTFHLVLRRQGAADISSMCVRRGSRAIIGPNGAGQKLHAQLHQRRIRAESSSPFAGRPSST